MDDSAFRLEPIREWLAGPRPVLWERAVRTNLPIPKTAREALRQSIAKWEFIAEQVRAGELVHDGSVMTCGLCRREEYSDRQGCNEATGSLSSCDCPVAKSGFPACKGTPYDEYCRACDEGRIEDALKAAEAEIRFLQELLRKEEQGANRV